MLRDRMYRFCVSQLLLREETSVVVTTNWFVLWALYFSMFLTFTQFLYKTLLSVRANSIILEIIALFMDMDWSPHHREHKASVL
jgi:divalent metal cation (Fe/Co/Zn/Cd) transporter